jgi:nucleotide-binding universal stress UspA family protein
VRILERKSAFAEFRNAAGSAVVHLIRPGGTWLLEDFYGPGNEAPHVEVEDAAVAYLKAHGIERTVRIREESPWASLRRIAGHFDFEF